MLPKPERNALRLAPLLLALCLDASAADPRSSALLGYGQSIPGFGDTTERVGTLDVAYRYRHVLHARMGKGWYEGSHELWIELPVSLILSNRNDRDQYELGMLGINFLFAWVFSGTARGSPYVVLGGGPRYVLADIEGVGSSTPGNYQAGLGYRFPGPWNTLLTADLRYVHISNLGLADPNVPLNSVAAYLGISFR